jgi:hypothetical protein
MRRAHDDELLFDGAQLLAAQGTADQIDQDLLTTGRSKPAGTSV